MLLVVLAAALAIGWVVNGRRQRARAIDELLAPASGPFVAAGFAPIASEGWVRADVADVSLPAGACVVAVANASGAAPGTATLTVQRDGATTEATGSIGFCTCATEHAVVTATSGPAEGRAVRVLTRDARAFGGSTGFALVADAARPRTVVDSPCAEEHFDAWIAQKRFPNSPLPAAWLTDPSASALAPASRAALAHAGFTPVASAPAGRPFAVVVAPPASCTLVVGDAAGDELSLRVEGGDRPVEHARGAIGFCAEHAPVVSVWHKTGSLAVVSAKAERLGGVLGLVEIARRSHLVDGPLATWRRDEDLVWDTTALLRASGVTEVTVTDYGSPTANGAPAKDARVVAIGAENGAAVSADTASDLVFSTCAPPIADDGRTVCAQAAPQRWRDTSQKGHAASAQAALPFWMKPYAQTRDPHAVQAIVLLLSLARRLAPERFDPTVLEAVTELPSGADVLGRAGEDAIVAVGLEPTPPFVYTYAEGGAKPWELGGEPKVIDLAPGAHVLLKPSASPTAPIEQRRTVVFRRTAK